MKPRFLGAITALFLFLAAFSGCVVPDVPYEPGDTSADTSNASVTLPEGSAFAVHFIDVGQADAALVVCDGKTMLIDGGNAEDSNLIYTYLKKQNISHLDYVVCTHAHEDHVGGLSGALTAATALRIAPTTAPSIPKFTAKSSAPHNWNAMAPARVFCW